MRVREKWVVLSSPLNAGYPADPGEKCAPNIADASKRFSLPDSGDEAVDETGDPPLPWRVCSRYQRSKDRFMSSGMVAGYSPLPMAERKFCTKEI